ncbi:hypothetical protein [Streptomyces sp. VRA16 Mangrove soil]|uniref:hypothetical protein n=1 Tax=Streptomyces sp. VRA16 Mangrove soil TaxID=2817434 RepID=UPI001A9EE8B0|nr:hypothetical protein [Streptomyces sp. VRA16 Mangrove soil]MBO1333093.1 hypothetical protein [Streptomyces sp. VRA16 Mangrove soil]
MINKRRLGSAALAALALTALPATAHADAAPPKGCASTTGYSTDEWHSGELTVCFTEAKAYRHSEGREVLVPAARVAAKCWTKGLFWNERDCEFSADLTLKKGDEELWKKTVGRRTDRIWEGHTSVTNTWGCAGAGQYRLTLDNIDMSVVNPDNGRLLKVHPAPVTVTAEGC